MVILDHLFYSCPEYCRIFFLSLVFWNFMMMCYDVFLYLCAKHTQYLLYYVYSNPSVLENICKLLHWWPSPFLSILCQSEHVYCLSSLPPSFPPLLSSPCSLPLSLSFNFWIFLQREPRSQCFWTQVGLGAGGLLRIQTCTYLSPFCKMLHSALLGDPGFRTFLV